MTFFKPVSRLLIALNLVILVCSPIAAAKDGTSTHGGDLVICPTNTGNYGQFPVVLDYYHARIFEKNLLLSHFQETIEARIRLYAPQLYQHYALAKAVAGDWTTWPVVPRLQDGDDNKEFYDLPDGCRFMRAAGRPAENDLKVFLSVEALNALRRLDMSVNTPLGLLAVHENLGILANHFLNRKNTQTVRQFMTTLLKAEVTPDEIRTAADVFIGQTGDLKDRLLATALIGRTYRSRYHFDSEGEVKFTASTQPELLNMSVSSPGSTLFRPAQFIGTLNNHLSTIGYPSDSGTSLHWSFSFDLESVEVRNWNGYVTTLDLVK